MHIFYIIRAIGGLLYLIGALLMAYNLYRTAKGDVAANEVARSPAAAAVAAE
jgi:cytochrome c oxidase cbb3-type subunit 1